MGRRMHQKTHFETKNEFFFLGRGTAPHTLLPYTLGASTLAPIRAPSALDLLLLKPNPGSGAASG